MVGVGRFKVIVYDLVCSSVLCKRRARTELERNMTTPPFWILIGSCIGVVATILTALATFWNTNKQEKDKAQAARRVMI